MATNGISIAISLFLGAFVGRYILESLIKRKKENEK